MSYKKVLIQTKNPIQLLNKSTYPASNTVSGITWTNNGDGTITASGTSTANYTQYVLPLTAIQISRNHKYLMTGCPAGGSGTTYYYNIAVYNSSGWDQFVVDTADNGNGAILSMPDKPFVRCGLTLNYRLNASATNQIWRPQFYDLTAMFGKGNEPKTVAEFRAKFPEAIYPYSPSCISFQKVLISSHVAQLLDKSTYPASKTSNGVEFTNNNDGTITANGTSTTNNAQYDIGGSYVRFVPTHVYYMTGCPVGGSTTTYYMSCSIYNGTTYVGGGSDVGDGVRFVMSNKDYTRYGISLNYRKDATADNHVWKPQLIDLTYWFGKGNEPKTAAEAKAKITGFYGYLPPVKSCLNQLQITDAKFV